LKEPGAKATHCILCSEEITQDNKSPVIGCCFACWESQETIHAAIQTEATDCTVESTTPACKAAAAETASADQPLAATDVEELPTWLGQEEPRVGNGVECENPSFLDGDSRKSQKQCIELWKASSEEHKQAFRDMVTSKAAGAQASPACLDQPISDKGASTTMCLPPDYTVEKLKADFAYTSDSPGSHDQKPLGNLLLDSLADSVSGRRFAARHPCGEYLSRFAGESEAAVCHSAQLLAAFFFAVPRGIQDGPDAQQEPQLPRVQGPPSVHQVS
jgi:hypothetical protein